MMCNYRFLHLETYMWAWSRVLQKSVPALALAHHIRQQCIIEKQLSYNSYWLLEQTNRGTQTHYLSLRVVKS